MNKAKRTIEQALTALKGKPAWRIQRTYGSAFFLELGKPIPRMSNTRGIYFHGEWHFLVDVCHWRIENGDALVIGSEDDQKIIDEIFDKELKLGYIELVTLQPPLQDLHITFSSGLCLRTFSSYGAEKDATYWNLYCEAEKEAWGADVDGKICYEPLHRPALPPGKKH